jgi:hypothetical protein
MAVEWGSLGTPPDTSPERLEPMIKRLRRMGIDHVRIDLPMRYTQDIATNPNHPALEMVRRLRQGGLDIIAIVGMGTVNDLPKGMNADHPDYLPLVSKNVAEVVRAVAPLGVTRFQLENELNAAGLVTNHPWRWRRGRRWGDFDFKMKLMNTLAEVTRNAAAEVGQPTVTLSTNFYDSFSDPIVHGKPKRVAEWTRKLGAFFHRNQKLEYAIRELSRPLDRVGVDFYPDYFIPGSVARLVGLPASIAPWGGVAGVRDAGQLLIRRVHEYQRMSGKEVYVAETGYETSSPFSPIFHTRRGQVRFISEIAAAAHRSGATGLTVFRYDDPPAKPARFLDFNLNRSVEPFVGLYDAKARPKTAWRWGLRPVKVWGMTLVRPVIKRVSAAAALRLEIKRSRS